MSPDYAPDYASHFVAAIVAGGFVLLAVVVVTTVLVASRGQNIQWGKLVLGGLSLLWLVPVFLILASVVLPAIQRTRQTAVPGELVVASAETQPALAVVAHDPRGEIEFPAAETNSVAAPRPAQAHVQAEAPLGQQPAPVTATVPDWVNEREIRSDEKRLIVLTSKRYATVQEGDVQLLNLARNEIERDLRATYHYEGSPSIPQQEIQKAFGRRHVEEFTVQTGSSTFPVYVVHRQLEISPSLRQSLERVWREKIGNRQLWSLSMLAGFITLILGTLAAYFRLDTRTGSAYRGRLRFAAVCLIMAGGVVAMKLIAV